MRLGVRLCVFLMAGAVALLPAQDRTRTPDRNSRVGTQGQNASGDGPEGTVPVPPEEASVTKHDWAGGGTTIHYTATAGNLLIKDEKDAVN